MGLAEVRTGTKWTWVTWGPARRSSWSPPGWPTRGVGRGHSGTGPFPCGSTPILNVGVRWDGRAEPARRPDRLGRFFFRGVPEEAATFTPTCMRPLGHDSESRIVVVLLCALRHWQVTARRSLWCLQRSISSMTWSIKSDVSRYPCAGRNTVVLKERCGG